MRVLQQKEHAEKHARSALEGLAEMSTPASNPVVQAPLQVGYGARGEKDNEPGSDAAELLAEDGDIEADGCERDDPLDRRRHT